MAVLTQKIVAQVCLLPRAYEPCRSCEPRAVLHPQAAQHTCSYVLEEARHDAILLWWRIVLAKLLALEGLPRVLHQSVIALRTRVCKHMAAQPHAAMGAGLAGDAASLHSSITPFEPQQRMHVWVWTAPVLSSPCLSTPACGPPSPSLPVPGPLRRRCRPAAALVQPEGCP